MFAILRKNRGDQSGPHQRGREIKIEQSSYLISRPDTKKIKSFKKSDILVILGDVVILLLHLLGVRHVDPVLKENLVSLPPVFVNLGILLSYLLVRSGVDPSPV